MVMHCLFTNHAGKCSRFRGFLSYICCSKHRHNMQLSRFRTDFHKFRMTECGLAVIF